jgi:hypothetical protein
MKNGSLVALIGAFMGIVAASFVVPPLLAWYTEPGGLPKGAAVQAVVQIPEVIRYATSRLILGQALGAVAGAGIALTLFMMLRSRGRGDSRPEPRPGTDGPRGP